MAFPGGGAMILALVLWDPSQPLYPHMGMGIREELKLSMAASEEVFPGILRTSWIAGGLMIRRLLVFSSSPKVRSG